MKKKKIKNYAHRIHIIYNTVSALEPVNGLGIVKEIEKEYKASLRGVIYVYLNSMVDDGFLFCEERLEPDWDSNVKRLYYTTNGTKRPFYTENKTQKTFWGGLTPSTS